MAILAGFPPRYQIANATRPYSQRQACRAYRRTARQGYECGELEGAHAERAASVREIEDRLRECIGRARCWRALASWGEPGALDRWASYCREARSWLAALRTIGPVPLPGGAA